MGYKDNFSCFLLQEEKQKKGLAGANPCAIGRTISRFLFYLVIYLRNLHPGNERAAHLSLRTFQYTWSCWSWCRHRHMSPYNVVSSCLAVSPLPPKRRFVFCYGIHKITPICAFHSRMLCPVRTFLTRRRDKSSYLYVNELFISELTLDTVIFSVKTLDLLAESRRDVLAMLVALHGS